MVWLAPTRVVLALEPFTCVEVSHGALACTAKSRVGNGALHVKRTCGSVTVCWPWCTGLHRQDSCWQWSSSREENVWKCHSVLTMVHWLAPPRFVLAMEPFT